jgi:hypothetical protein
MSFFNEGSTSPVASRIKPLVYLKCEFKMNVHLRLANLGDKEKHVTICTLLFDLRA